MTPVVKRTPREWTEACRECGGSGTVHKREYFSLWTPDEYGHAIALDAKHDVPKDAYVCAAMAGASIGEACKEGVGLARMLSRPVVFEFNDKVAVCFPESDPDNVARRWWVLAYGETYEQSMAKR